MLGLLIVVLLSSCTSSKMYMGAEGARPEYYKKAVIWFGVKNQFWYSDNTSRWQTGILSTHEGQYLYDKKRNTLELRCFNQHPNRATKDTAATYPCGRVWKVRHFSKWPVGFTLPNGMTVCSVKPQDYRSQEQYIDTMCSFEKKMKMKNQRRGGSEITCIRYMALADSMPARMYVYYTALTKREARRLAVLKGYSPY